MNKRPIAFLAFFLVLGIAVAYYTGMGGVWTGAAAAVSAVLFLVLLLKSSRVRLLPLYALAFFLGAFLFGLAYRTDYSRIDFHKEYTVLGRVSGRERMNQQTHKYTLTGIVLQDGATEIDFSKKAFVYSAEVLEYGDVVSFDTKIEEPSTPRNPGGFDEKMYYAANGVGFSCYAWEIRCIGNEWGINAASLAIREKLAGTIDQVYTEETAPVAKAMLLGIKDELPEELREDFSKTGIAHILAISGLHVAILLAALDFILKKLRAPRRMRFVIEIALLIAYAFITALAPSVMRAVLMCMCITLGRWLFKKRDTLTFLCLAMVVLLLINPAQLFMAGFLMSFGTVFGILCLMPVFSRGLERLGAKNAFTDMLSVSCAASIVVFPLTAYYFDIIVYAAPLANFYAIPLAALIVVFTGLSGILGVLWIPLGGVFALLSQVCIAALVYCNNALVQSGFGYVGVSGFPVLVAVVIFGVFFVCSDYVFIRGKWKAVIAAAVSAVLVLAMTLPGAASGPNRLEITILDVGTGDAVHVAAGQTDVLVDNGGSLQRSNIESYAKDNKIDFDYILVTNDRTNNLQTLIGEGYANTLYVPQNYIPKDWDAGISVIPYKLYDTIELEGGAALEIVADDGKNTSVMVTVDGKNTCLLAQNSAEELAGVGTVPAVKLAGGGSENSVSAGFLEEIQPAYAVVSVKGINEKSLPDEGAMQLLDVYGTETLCTAQAGAVTIWVDANGELAVRTMK
ncbi:MAG: ComEC/Rec2 family competence protein [Christensenellaceae bacterium]